LSKRFRDSGRGPSLFFTLAILLLGSSFSLTAAKEIGTMQITSPVFDHDGMIPAKYTCDGADRSPPLAWRGVPENTKSLVLIVDDPDAPDPAAPRMTWVHWALYDIPPTVTGLAEGAADHLPPGVREGMNDFRRTRYGGPCPPIGKHRYFFKLYALDKTLGPLPHANKASVEKAMQGHILMMSELVGLYQKGR
jgi:Raf kinase inhibitor-like YbhB/YbcL family protein